MTVDAILRTLKAHGNRRNVEGMARFGISSTKAYGVRAPFIHALARSLGTNHELAIRLWSTGVLEARIVAAMIGDPSKTTRALMNRWVCDFDNWAVCDGTCSYLFDKTPHAYTLAVQWSRREEEFVRRAGFVLMATLAVHDKGAPDEQFLKFLPIIEHGSADTRNFVKKAVNWALRQIGKRNVRLNNAALKSARTIRKQNSGSARWIASDAIRELEGPSVRRRLAKKKVARP